MKQKLLFFIITIPNLIPPPFFIPTALDLQKLSPSTHSLSTHRFPKHRHAHVPSSRFRFQLIHAKRSQPSQVNQQTWSKMHGWLKLGLCCIHCFLSLSLFYFFASLVFTRRGKLIVTQQPLICAWPSNSLPPTIVHFILLCT